MADAKDPLPIPAYIFGELTAEEQASLMRLAMDDQDVFDQVWEAAEDRQLLQNPAIRRRLLRHLEGAQEPASWRMAWRRLIAPGGLLLATAAAVCLALFVYYGPHPWQTEQPLTLVTGPSTDLSVFFQLPLHNDNARLFFNEHQYQFHPGEVIHATLRLPRPAAVFALRRQTGSAPRLVFPADFATAADQPAGDLSLAFDPVSPTEDVTSRRRFALRVIILPPGTDLRTQSVEWAKFKDAYSALEIWYDVVP